jgi:spore germination cell wall hydrolase CwlJ-like protein
MTLKTALALILINSTGALVDADELICLSDNVYHEARGETQEGQIAVAYVTINRVGDGRFGETICEVVYEDGQFSWTDDGEKKIGEKLAYLNAMRTAIAAIDGSVDDPTFGATYYYNPKAAKPRWARKFTESAVIGAHRFMRDEG